MSDTNETNIGYGAAFDSYWALGWRGVLPLPTRAKNNPPSVKCVDARAKPPRPCQPGCECIHYTGYGAVTPSYPDIMAWGEQFPDGNLCLHLPHCAEYTIVGVDVDAYGAKTGAQTLVEAIRRWGPLPSAPRTTSRAGDLISGIRLFRVPPGTALETRVNFPDLGIGDIEICQPHHRYAVAWPSIHPNGGVYQWRDEADRLLPLPKPEELPWLPQAWIDGLRVQPRTRFDGPIDFDVAAALTPGDPSTIVRKRLGEAFVELNRPGSSRHDVCCRHVLALARLGKSGEFGVKTALQQLCDVFTAVVVADGSRSPDSARAEFIRMITNENLARELSKPGITDWVTDMIGMLVAEPSEPPRNGQETPVYDQIAPDPAPKPPGNDSAPSNGEIEGAEPVTNADTSGGAIVDDSAPHSPLIEIERGFWESRESLAMIYQTAMARMAPPWGTLAHCATRALTMVPPRVVLPPVIGGPGSLNFFVATVAHASGGKGASAAAANVLIPKEGFRHCKIGSGEGIVAAFGRIGDEDSPPEHECIMFTTNEIDTLKALNGRSASTTLPILREAFFGEDLGFAYSAKDKRRHIPEHSYRMTFIVAAQPNRMDWLLADADGGTPQRFMWLPASDARISRRNKPWETGPLTLPKVTEWIYPRTIQIPPEAQELIEIEHEKRSQGSGEAIDGHALFCREKFAYALALLDGRINMTSEDWELSGVAADVSVYTREMARDAVREAARIDALDRGEIRGMENAAADESKQYEEAERVRKALRWTLSKIESAGPEGISTRDLTNAADSKRTRRWLSAALQIAQSNGLVRPIEGTTLWVKI